MEVKWLPFAQGQLKVVLQYVIDNFGEKTARKTLREILSHIDGLKVFPDSGVWDKRFSTATIKVRHLNIGPNVVYYLVDLDEVLVVAVMHYKQSPATINRTIRYALSIKD